MEQLSFFSIEKKIQNAITLLKMFEAKAIEMHPEGYYVVVKHFCNTYG